MQARLLWVEGRRADDPPLVSALRKKGFIVEIAEKGIDALDRIFDFDPDLIVINTASMRTSGKRICRNIYDHANGIPILVISNPDQLFPENIGANVIIYLPFTVRKLINRITPLLPGEGSNLLHVGPIRLDIERKRVRCYGRDNPITPRTAQLLKYLMEHPGEALMREDLFRHVWETEYTVDTRTLDVHINWLRQVLEEDPRKPRHLKTIRGVGYRLDI